MEYATVFIYLMLPLAGIGVIGCAAIWRKHLTGRTVIDLSLNKLGVGLKADAFGLLVLLGLVMTSPPVFFWYKGYEDRLATLQGQVKDMETKLATMDETMRALKEYELRLSLLFPENDPANPFTAAVNAYVRKKGESGERPYDQIRIDRGIGGIVVHFDKLSLNDKVYVLARDGDKKWRSDDMVTPGAYLKMHRIKD